MLLLLQRIFSEVPVLMLFIIFNCGPLIMDASLVLEDFFGRSRIPANNLRFKLSFTVVFFRMVHKKKLFRRSNVKYRTFSEREVIYFPYIVRKIEKLP